MQYYYTAKFKKQYKKLPQQIKELLQKQLGFLLVNPQHPSLNIKKINDPREIWEARITDSYRFTFQIQTDFYILRTVGTHDVLRKP
jgi:mRNA-degrading endonuclease RelE of RelBE toxin-antitoxin system